MKSISSIICNASTLPVLLFATRYLALSNIPRSWVDELRQFPRRAQWKRLWIFRKTLLPAIISLETWDIISWISGEPLLPVKQAIASWICKSLSFPAPISSPEIKATNLWNYESLLGNFWESNNTLIFYLLSLLLSFGSLMAIGNMEKQVSSTWNFPALSSKPRSATTTPVTKSSGHISPVRMILWSLSSRIRKSLVDVNFSSVGIGTSWC